MNFGMLKNMVQNILTTYKCPFCATTDISEQNIDIVGAAGNTVNIDLHCPKCRKHFMIKTEIVHMELWNIPQEKLKQIQQSLEAIKGKMGWEWALDTEIEGVKEEDILKLRWTLKNKEMSVEDLFSES